MKPGALICRRLGAPLGGVAPGLVRRCLIFIVFFIAAIPTLSWPPLHDIVERINIVTALELKRDGHWLVPTLNGAPRLAKPPLTAWITAALVRPSTAASLSSLDPAVREAALGRLAFEARLPSLLAMCLMLVALYDFGATLGDRDTGLAAALVAGSSWMFLSQSRLATVDAQLALWVVVTNLFVSKALFQGRRWLGCVGGGTALGLGLMCKGPVALIQTALPLVVFQIWRRRANGSDPLKIGRTSRWFFPVATGVVLMLAVGLWWYVLVFRRFPGLAKFWASEATGYGADEVPPDARYKHLLSLKLFLPWIAWLAIGIVLAVAAVRRREEQRTVFALLLLVVPLGLMSFGKDQKERYLLPLLAPGAVLAGDAIMRRARSGTDGAVRVAHGIITVGFVAGMCGTAMGKHTALWSELRSHPPYVALMAAALAGAGVLWMTFSSGLRRYRTAGFTAALMLFVGVVYFFGQPRDEADSNRALADRIWREYPDAVVYALSPPKGNPMTVPATDLSLYLNRTVHWTDRWPQPPPGQATQVAQIVTTVRGRGEPPPEPPSGWHPLVLAGGRDHSRYTYVLP